MGICVACNADVEEMDAHKAEMHPEVDALAEPPAEEEAPEAPATE